MDISRDGITVDISRDGIVDISRVDGCLNGMWISQDGISVDLKGWDNCGYLKGWMVSEPF